ncbi:MULTISPECIES: triphosphoribosyl-dephospho-CoA synthase MdcB [unclassified Acidisoma]|jgi:triphosphoribosyl-dephospho-CoA synthase|uniref:triphosphoribosyl-dephospho-CoA synthase MdcB n=1 Tax=unclassified Acidisoma TaxID=2634065 RepID=UPI00131E973B|nr:MULTISPECIES: triphosphoribosyl-dephospho-CoA synthase MdcB [unclassified Acidisoma]
MNATIEAFASRSDQAAALAEIAVRCLRLELETWPKPGLVSHIDSGSHADMDATMLRASAATLRSHFAALVAAGTEGATMPRLRQLGLAAERDMLARTGGVNTHRGAIFALGLLCAAAGFLGRRGGVSVEGSLGRCVRTRWGEAIMVAVGSSSHGAKVRAQHGAGGARSEAANGFDTVYRIGLPALRWARRHHAEDDEPPRVQCFFALLAAVEDTNLLYRGGAEGLVFAREAARRFLEGGGVARPKWRDAASVIHAEFVRRGLSPGGCADLLAAALFIDLLEV